MGGHVASKDEMEEFTEANEIAAHLRYMEAVRDNFESIAYVKEQLAAALWAGDDDEQKELALLAAIEAWREIGSDYAGDQHNFNNPMNILWRAPTKGGIFTTKERALIKEAASAAERKRIADE